MAALTYIIETNGENGVYIQYHQLDYTPQDVVWDYGNTYSEGSVLPDAGLSVSPEYVRRLEDGVYAYYRRVVVMPSKSASFSLYVLRDEVPVEYIYEDFSSFLMLFRQGNGLLVKSKTNVSGDERNGVISIKCNIGGETLIVPVVQEYTPIRIRLLSYEYNGFEYEGSGLIDDVIYEHTFHWLTSKMSPDKETLEIEIASFGPRNGYIIRDISEYAYVGGVDDTYVVSGTTGKYYQTKQSCDGGNILMVADEVIFNTSSSGIYKKVDYKNDLNVIRDGKILKIVNYGRCFLQEDAYYVITLSNVDDLRETATIIVRYEDDSRGSTYIQLVDPLMYIRNGHVIIQTENESNASGYFGYDVTLNNGRLMFGSSNREILDSSIVNNELVALINL